MYKKHDLFLEPKNQNVKIWRYIDFTKLISLLETTQLFFAKSDLFEDPFEGSWPLRNIEERLLMPHEIPDEMATVYYDVMKNVTDFYRFFKGNVAISCWHMNEHESAAMWKLYLKSNEGIAVQSTFSRLKECITDDRNVHLGKVKYIDYETEKIESDNAFSPYMHKRMSYDHEKEIRAVVAIMPKKIEGGLDFTQPVMSGGLNINVDIKILIENIYIAPTAPAWLFDLVKSVVLRYGYDFPVTQSQMNKAPLF